MIHLHTLVGGRVTTLRPMLEHYRSIGVQSFLVNVHLTSTEDPLLDEVQAITNDFGVPIASVVYGNWQELIIQTYAKSRNLYPNDWHILADQDEFHTFPYALPELEDRCNKGGYHYVNGCWVDRIAADGGFPEVDPKRSMWEQFPVGTFFSYPVAAADPRKVVLTRSGVNLAKGQHFATNAKGCPVAEAFAQVHHFKWVAGIVPTLEARAEFLRAGGYTQHIESSRFLKHFKDNKGHINVSDPRILAAKCAQDYPHIPLIQKWLILLSDFLDVGKQLIPGPSNLASNPAEIVRQAGKLFANIQVGTDGQPYQKNEEQPFFHFEPLRLIWLNSRY